jgi:enoyl-CoA hydratase
VSAIISTTVAGVATIELAAPERRNALDRPMLAELATAIEAVREDREARVVIVRGAGPSFCAGADLNSLFGDVSRSPADIREDLKGVYGSFLGLQELRIPTIAAVRGFAVGAGVNIAMACDVVVADPGASFVLSFADLGLHPGGGCSWFLTRRLGHGTALATLLSADTLSADRAAALGLVTEIHDDPDARAQQLADHWATRDPQLLRDIKRAVQLAATAELADVVELESWAQASSATKPAFDDHLTRLAAKAAARAAFVAGTRGDTDA